MSRVQYIYIYLDTDGNHPVTFVRKNGYQNIITLQRYIERTYNKAKPWYKIYATNNNANAMEAIKEWMTEVGTAQDEIANQTYCRISSCTYTQVKSKMLDIQRRYKYTGELPDGSDDEGGDRSERKDNDQPNPTVIQEHKDDDQLEHKYDDDQLDLDDEKMDDLSDINDPDWIDSDEENNSNEEQDSAITIVSRRINSIGQLQFLVISDDSINIHQDDLSIYLDQGYITERVIFKNDGLLDVKWCPTWIDATHITI